MLLYDLAAGNFVGFFNLENNGPRRFFVQLKDFALENVALAN